MNPSEPNVPNDVSTKTTASPGGFFQRAVWTAGLIAIGSVLAVHAALAFSPDLARYVPDALVKSPAAASSCQATPCSGPAAGGCHAKAMLSAEFGGCCSMRAQERPCLTDGVDEDDIPDATAELPADALMPESASPLPEEEPAPQASFDNSDSSTAQPL